MHRAHKSAHHRMCEWIGVEKICLLVFFYFHRRLSRLVHFIFSVAFFYSSSNLLLETILQSLLRESKSEKKRQEKIPFWLRRRRRVYVEGKSRSDIYFTFCLFQLYIFFFSRSIILCVQQFSFVFSLLSLRQMFLLVNDSVSELCVVFACFSLLPCFVAYVAYAFFLTQSVYFLYSCFSFFFSPEPYILFFLLFHLACTTILFRVPAVQKSGSISAVLPVPSSLSTSAVYTLTLTHSFESTRRNLFTFFQIAKQTRATGKEGTSRIVQNLCAIWIHGSETAEVLRLMCIRIRMCVSAFVTLDSLCAPKSCEQANTVCVQHMCIVRALFRSRKHDAKKYTKKFSFSLFRLLIIAGVSSAEKRCKQNTIPTLNKKEYWYFFFFFVSLFKTMHFMHIHKTKLLLFFSHEIMPLLWLLLLFLCR